MTDERHDPIHARTDPALILDAVQTGVGVAGLGYALLKDHGAKDAPPAPPAPAPEPPAETPPMPGFNE